MLWKVITESPLPHRSKAQPGECFRIPVPSSSPSSLPSSKLSVYVSRRSVVLGQSWLPWTTVLFRVLCVGRSSCTMTLLYLSPLCSPSSSAYTCICLACHHLSHTSRAFTFAAHSKRTATAAATGTEEEEEVGITRRPVKRISFLS